jgi:hypothetical protein
MPMHTTPQKRLYGMAHSKNFAKFTKITEKVNKLPNINGKFVKNGTVCPEKFFIWEKIIHLRLKSCGQWTICIID